ncbi:hypothetical protein [Roseateles sp.]|uniref:hypothetical protein n=1 Tax=Roseateles sp. TaxID=1971397 RepID=UPI0031D65FFE
MSSRFVTDSLARAAIDAIAPSILTQLAAPEVSGLGVLHLVVLDPAVAWGDGVPQPRILHEQSIGDRAKWDVDYADYARRKAWLSWRHRMDSRRLQLLEPHRLVGDDALLWGGVHLDGLVVAASGAFPIWDECFSLMTAAQIRARVWEAADRASR